MDVWSNKIGSELPTGLLESDRDPEDDERRRSVLVDVIVDMLSQPTGREVRARRTRALKDAQHPV